MYSYKPFGTKAEYYVKIAKDQNDLSSSVKTIQNLDNKTVVYIIDRNLPSRYSKLIMKLFHFKKSYVVLVNPLAKTINALLPIYDAMVEMKPDMAIVLGGGTIGDLSGFACATYQRGIPRIYFPTTSLSMIDASVGGKNGIDYLGSKNSLSVRHYPQYTFMYLPFLRTLPSNEFRSGFAETVKLSVTANMDLFFELKTFITKGSLLKNFDKLRSIILHSSKTKARICEKSEYNQITLLYGHAIGHAIESISPRRMRHGDCISIGMQVEGALACMLGIWNLSDWISQMNILKLLELPTDIPKGFSLESIVRAMDTYKKLRNEYEYLFVLPESIGKMHNIDGTFLTAIKKTNMIKLLKKTL